MARDTTTSPPNAETYAARARSERVSTVGSTSLAEIAFDPETGHVFVSWLGGQTYCYEGVGPDQWEAFKVAESKGRFANQLKAAGYVCRGPLL